MRKSATIKDVAALAGVSLGTVSNYINETKTVSAATAARIEEAIESLRFVPNSGVRTLRGRSSKVIGFVVPDATNPFFTELARHIEDAALAQDCVVVFCDTAGSRERERDYLRRLAEMRVTGVVLISIDHDAVDLRDLEAVDARVVLLGDEKEGVDASSITVDEKTGSYLAMSHLLSLGRRNILFAGGPGGGDVLNERVAGAKKALSDHPSVTDARLRRVDATGRTTSERAALVDAILESDDPPDAVLCGNDMIAMTIMNALLRRGASIPEDVAIVGHDDIEAAQLAVIPLTTVRQPIDDLGRTAAELLFNRRDLAGPQHVTLRPELVVRESTLRPPGSPTIQIRKDPR